MNVAVSEFAAAALGYAARGWSVIPMQPHDKRPLIAWREFQQRVAGAEEIAAWFARRPDANIGIVTGRLSGLVVVDVDVRHGGPDSVAQLEARHGPLPPSVESATGGGGRHLYFAHPGHLVSNRVALLPGVDLRGDGGCVVAPPSIHPNGQRYRWLPGHAPGERALAAWPAHFGGQALPATGAAGHSRPYWRRLIRDGVAEGRRNQTLASLTGHLLRREVDFEAVLELMLAWNRAHCRPPLPDDEVAQVVHSIAHTHARGEAVVR